jgi:CubicO group peptidase (beta-lactamase class C family)
MTSAMLLDLPGQPPGLPWPTSRWPEATGEAPSSLVRLVDEAFEPDSPLAQTYAVVVVHRGRLVLERYGGALPHLDGPAEPVGPDTPLLSWSMAKSVLHALVGILIEEGHLQLDQPPPGIPWTGPGSQPAAPEDPRHGITLEQMLEMRDGLDFNEDYVDDRISDTIAMLYGPGQADVVAYAASRPLRHPPGQTFNYSSGTSNLLSAAVHAVVGRGEALASFAEERLFDPLGIKVKLGLDPSGTWVASSYAYATARDWARFGYLYLRGGRWDTGRVLPGIWVDHARLARSVDPTDGSLHSAHWWVVDDQRGTFWASGYRGQCIVVCPALDAVVVRLGDTPAQHYPELRSWRAGILAALAD